MKTVLFVLALGVAAHAVETPSAQEIVSRMKTMNVARAAALHSYRTTRTYRVSYKGFPKLTATAVVRLEFTAPDEKQFIIVSEDGSKLLVNKVIKKALESETEAGRPEFRDRSALDDSNYDFKLLGDAAENGRPCYLLQVTPKREDKYLYDGKICVDAADYAVVKINANPAKNPSFWISKAHIESHNQKVGDFWFPTSLHSTSHVRLGGDAEMNIEYGPVEVTSASPLRTQLPAGR